MGWRSAILSRLTPSNRSPLIKGTVAGRGNQHHEHLHAGPREIVEGHGARLGDAGGFTPHGRDMNKLHQRLARRQLESPPIDVVTQIAAGVVRQLRRHSGLPGRDGEPLMRRVAPHGEDAGVPSGRFARADVRARSPPLPSMSSEVTRDDDRCGASTR